MPWPLALMEIADQEALVLDTLDWDEPHIEADDRFAPRRSWLLAQ
ncbi:hypothetical protein [Bradyrhizobium sp. 186]|nr:hypothetical protein [Bradyrhizobium sp. 186]